MRKTNDEEIQRMYSTEGQTKRAIAKHFGVSEQYIGKRLKQLEAFRLPDSFQRLTVKQKKYALARAEGKSKIDSAMEAYDTKDKNSAKALGYTLSKDPDVDVAIQDLLAQEGIPRRRRIQRLRDMIESQDLSIVGKGIELSCKLTGDFAPEKHLNLNIDHSVITARLADIHRRMEEIRQRREKLLAEIAAEKKEDSEEEN
jgi:transposase-like protein